MIAQTENYLSHLIELKDAGTQLVRLLSGTGQHCQSFPQKRKNLKVLREAEACIAQLEEVIHDLEAHSSLPGRGRNRDKATLSF